jgi:hypothetical protein
VVVWVHNLILEGLFLNLGYKDRMEFKLEAMIGFEDYGGWGYLGQLFELWRVLELDGERKDSRFILVRALDRDRVIALCLVGVSLCVGLIVLSYLLLQGCPSSLFILIEKAVVRLQS